MGTLAPAFNHVSKPISPNEFRDAVLATCKPRFPTVRFARSQRIALAVSGGVDSMAMAFLFSTLLKSYRGIKIADNPAESALAIVVDHQLREGSSQEASRVVQEVKRLGLRAVVNRLNWKDATNDLFHPSELPNLEGLARTMRFRAMGSTCRFLQSSSLFFAHHRDDQYETVLMRLLAGHGYRGLQGIREANAIPECYDLNGVYKSGLLDDQMQQYPFLSFKPPNREMRRLRQILRHEQKAESWEQLQSQFWPAYGQTQFPGRIAREYSPNVPYLTPLNSEDGGVTIYRPLLAFDKDRLIATCEANEVQWFEDYTNKDPTLTTRNAIRYMTRNHRLPSALQKDSILAISSRAKRRTKLEEAEAQRLLVREAVIKDFDPNVGTLLIELPTFRPRYRGSARHHATAREEARIPQRRLIATIAVRNLLDFVTPERHLPPLSNLDKVVQRLFPALWPGLPMSEPRAFSMARVLFDPVPSSTPGKWFLSRAPYAANEPLPVRKLPGQHSFRKISVEERVDDYIPRFTHWRSWKASKMWDGRFWIRLSTCVAARFHLQPFLAQHAKAFRKALPPKSRARLEQMLKYYAPGKVRYSLPGLYSVESSTSAGGETQTTMTLLALPTLGISVPGLERWVKYEARYKRVDAALLGLQKRCRIPPPLFGYRQACSASRRRRRVRMTRRGRVLRERQKDDDGAVLSDDLYQQRRMYSY